jgi:proline iminopeptidase
VFVRTLGGGPRAPLIALHGGPGIPCDYFEMLAPLGSDRAVVLYDQLGCGRSPAPLDPGLWTLPRFVEELEKVREAVGGGKVCLLGHSWGAMLALDYALKHGQHVERLVFDSPIFSAEKFRQGVRSLSRPDDTLEAFYARHVCRLDPYPEPLQRSLAGINEAIYLSMWGPNELELVGSLAGYEREHELGKLRAPALYLVGETDEVRPEHVRSFAKATKGARVHVFEGCTHLKQLEDPEGYVRVVREFLSTTLPPTPLRSAQEE